MLANQTQPGVWEVEIAGDKVQFWLSERGIHSHRVESTNSAGRKVSHSPSMIGWSELLAKTEKQLTMGF